MLGDHGPNGHLYVNVIINCVRLWESDYLTSVVVTNCMIVPSSSANDPANPSVPGTFLDRALDCAFQYNRVVHFAFLTSSVNPTNVFP